MPASPVCAATPTPAAQFTSVRWGERLAELGAVPSIGSVGDSYDNALAEAVNGLYKTELIRGPAQQGRPWKTVDDVELATLGWVHWHNTNGCTATAPTSHRPSSKPPGKSEQACEPWLDLATKPSRPLP